MSQPPAADPAEIYRRRLEAVTAEGVKLRGVDDRISNARALAFVAALGCVFVGIYWPHAPVVGAMLLVAGLFSAGCFVFLLFKHAEIDRRQRRAEGLRRVNAEGLARVDRVWAGLPLPPMPAFVASDPVAADLDLFGDRSLFHLICTAVTPQGRQALAEKLRPKEAAGESGAAGRAPQEAVAELAAELDLRQQLQLGGAEDAVGQTAGTPPPAGEDPFLAWAAGNPILRPRPGFLWATRLLPGLLIVATVQSLVADRAWVVALTGLFVVRYALLARTGKAVQRQLNLVCTKERNLRGYGHLFGLLAAWQPHAAGLRALAERLRGADAAMRSLESLVTLAAIRTTPASPLAQWFFLWDYQTLFLMERWQQRHGAQVWGWFEALGEAEALAALGGVKFDHPEWPFPTFTDEANIEARGLGHPLLPRDGCVVNDVTLGPPGTFLLVTGSNMSGKSTLLRTVGMNVVLAQAGAPVCATELRLPAAGIILATSLRVQDSLQEGVSFFMAELRRLAGVVNRADALATPPGGPVLLYLLDEILRGTNTQERQVIVAKVVAHLLGRRAVGVVSTHDLSLAEIETLRGAARTVHFREEFEDGADGATMRFDYRMRPGLATTTNALKLLRVIGLKL